MNERARFEAMGEEEIRLRIPAFKTEAKALAYEWLGEKDPHPEQRRTDRITQIAAIVAAVAAVIGTFVAVIGTGIAIIAWLYPRH
jgi:hypothetical protein